MVLSIFFEIYSHFPYRNNFISVFPYKINFFINLTIRKKEGVSGINSESSSDNIIFFSQRKDFSIRFGIHSLCKNQINLILFCIFNYLLDIPLTHIKMTMHINKTVFYIHDI